MSKEVPPNPSLYVQNLNEKIKKEELKKSLYHVFSQFGNILDIQCKKTLALRGQAWIIYEDLGSATKALREMQGFSFYSKAMRVDYAKIKSDVISKRDGSFVPRPKRKVDGAPAKQAEAKKPKPTKAEPMEVETIETEDATDAPAGEAAAAADDAPKKAKEPEAPPNRILFVENLPEQCSEMMLSMLFQQYNGYKEARLVPSKPGIAFVEFGDQFQSAQAKESLQDFKITPTNLMKISFARQ